MTPLLTCDNLGFKASGKWLLSGVSFSIEPQSMVSVIGPNGGGKTTLLRILAGLQAPTTGSIHTSKPLTLGYVPQQLSVPESLPLTAKDFVNQAPCKLDQADWLELQHTLELDTFVRTPVQRLSGGQRQRLILARALRQKPDLLILDEPMQGVDFESQALLYQLISSWPKTHQTSVLVVSHDLEWVMAGTSKVLCINQHLCCQGLPDELKTEQEFLTLFGAPRQHYSHHHACSHEA